LAQGVTALELVILQPNRKQPSAFPALVRSLVAWINQGDTAFGVAFRAFNFDYHRLAHLNIFIYYLKDIDTGKE
jgi:hypothetical protein